VAQLYPPPDPIVPAHADPLANLLTRCTIIVLFSYDGSVHVANLWTSSATSEEHMRSQRSPHFVGLLFVGMALGCSAPPLGATEQSYPNRLIKIIYSEVAGGPSDIITRAIADKMSISLKQPIVIENRPGAGGNVGAEAIARAKPDGYTLGVVLGTTLTVNPSVYKKLPFDPDKDFRPLSIITTSGNMLVVHPSI